MAQLEYTIKLRSNTSSYWTTNNPTLEMGEAGVERDTLKMKVGDGATPWNTLSYNVLTKALVGVAGGIAPLNSSSKIDAAYIDQVATAGTTSFTPTGNIVASNVQTAIAEIDNEKQPLIASSTTDKFYRGDKSFENITTIDVKVAAARQIGSPTAVDTQSEVNTYVWSSGILNGCDLTDNGNGTINISAGTAILRSTASHSGVMYAAEVFAQTNLVLLDNSINYIYLDYSLGTPTFQTSSSTMSFNGQDKTIAYLAYRSGNIIHHVDARAQNVDFSTKTRNLFLGFSRFIHAEGGTALSSLSGTTISVTDGKFFFMLEEVTHPAFNTSVVGTANENIFKLWYRNGVGGWVESANQKSVTTTTYDNGSGTLATLTNNKYGVTWFYIVHNDPSSLHAVKGQAEYADLASAAAATPPASLPGLLSGIGSLIGKVAYLKSASSFAAVYSAFSQTFGSSAATTHNGLAGLQGGGINEYYHLTSAQQANLTAARTNGSVLFQGASGLTEDNANLFWDDTNNRLLVGTNTSDNISSLQVEGTASFKGLILPTVTKTTNYTATNLDYTIRCDSSTGALTITLPTATGNAGKLYNIKKVSGGNNVTIATTSSQTIDGSLTIVIQNTYDTITVQSNGTGWDIL